MTIIVRELSPTITVKDTSLKGKNICEVLLHIKKGSQDFYEDLNISNSP